MNLLALLFAKEHPTTRVFTPLANEARLEGRRRPGIERLRGPGRRRGRIPLLIGKQRVVGT